MRNLTPEGLRIVSDIAARHGFSQDAALSLLDSLRLGNGFQAQFQHPELGGMGQWSQGGMIMIGDMFNHGLKQRVDGLCNDLAALLREQPSIEAPSRNFQSQGQGGGTRLFAEDASLAWWPRELGPPASSGAQNDMRYAFFPGARRLAIQQGGEVRVYDTGEHQLSGFSQQQGSDRSLTFTGQYGPVRVADLALVSGEAAPSAPPPAPSAPSAAASPTSTRASVDEILKTIEGLAALRQKGILSEDEFAAKKAELLGRL
jgi:Short C-terminal domain